MAPPLALATGEIVGDAVSAWRGAVAGILTDDTIKNAIEREVFEQRGKFYATIAKQYGIDEENAKLIGRIIDNVQRAFILGILGDIVTSLAAGPAELTRGALPGVDILTEFAYDIIKLSSAMSEDIDIGEAAQPLRRSVERSIPFAGPAITRAREAAEKGTGKSRLQRVLRRKIGRQREVRR